MKTLRKRSERERLKPALILLAALLLFFAAAGCGNSKQTADEVAMESAGSTAAEQATAGEPTTAAAVEPTAATTETTTATAASAGNDADAGSGAESDNSGAETAASNEAEMVTTVAVPYYPDLPRADLIYYIAASEQEDSAAVQAAMDDYFLEKLNCTVKISPIQGSEWPTKVPLIFSAGEQVDLIFDQSARGFYTNVSTGLYYQLNDLLSKYGQELLAQMEANAPGLIDAPKINGVLYGIPCEKQAAQCEAWYFRKDIADEIGLDADKLTALQDLEPFLQKVAEKHPEMIPYYVSSGTGLNIEWTTDAIRDNPTKYEELAGVSNLLLVENETDKIINHYETGWDLDRYVTLKKWQDLGYINPDAATATVGGGEVFRAGKTWMVAGGGSPTVMRQMEESYGTQFYRWRATGPVINTYQNVTALTCVPRASVDSERAMMVINLLHIDPYIVNLFNSGIEGRHYVVNADGRFELPEGKSGRSDTGYAYGFEAYFGNMFLNSLWSGEAENRYDELREYNRSSGTSRISGFYVDTQNMMAEYAAVEAIRVEYAPILKAGVSPNVAQTLKEMNDRMYVGGLQKVLNSAQRQYDLFTGKIMRN